MQILINLVVFSF